MFRIKYGMCSDDQNGKGEDIAQAVLSDISNQNPTDRSLRKLGFFAYLRDTIDMSYREFYEANNRLHALSTEFEMPDEVYNEFRIVSNAS